MGERGGVDPYPARARKGGGMGEAVDVVQGKPTNQPGHTIFSDPEFPAKLSQHLPTVRASTCGGGWERV